MIPAFKRNYFQKSFAAFSNQTYKPKFYVIIQNDNKISLNLTEIQNIVNEPVYHIWMSNWNSLFFLNHVFKYDDDQWPNDVYNNEKIINMTKNNNLIVGGRGIIVSQSFCGYTNKFSKHIEYGIVDHAATPFLVRPGYFKLDARHKIFRLYGAEDIALSVNSFMICNVTSMKKKNEINYKG